MPRTQRSEGRKRSQKRRKKTRKKKEKPKKIISVAPQIGPSLPSPITTACARENRPYPFTPITSTPSQCVINGEGNDRSRNLLNRWRPCASTKRENERKKLEDRRIEEKVRERDRTAGRIAEVLLVELPLLAE